MCDQIREKTSGAGREEEEKQGHAAAKLQFCPPTLNSADETGTLTVPHLSEKGQVLFVLKYWGGLTSLYSILRHNVF